MSDEQQATRYSDFHRAEKQKHDGYHNNTHGPRQLSIVSHHDTALHRSLSEMHGSMLAAHIHLCNGDKATAHGHLQDALKHASTVDHLCNKTGRDSAGYIGTDQLSASVMHLEHRLSEPAPMAKGLADLARGLGKKVGLYRADHSALTTDKEGHEFHASQHAAAGKTGTPGQQAARQAIAKGHEHMAQAAHAFTQGNHTLARKHANLAAAQHAAAHGHDAGVASSHGGELMRAVNTLQPHVPGVHGVKDRSPAAASTPKAAPAAAPKHDFKQLAMQHQEAAGSVKPGAIANHHTAGTHNALANLAHAHTHAANAATALHAGDTKLAASHLERAHASLATARSFDSGMVNAREGHLPGSLSTMSAHVNMKPLAKADEGENRFQGVADSYLSTFRR